MFVLIAVAGFGVVRYFQAIQTAQVAHEQLLDRKLELQQQQIDHAQLSINVLVKASKTAQDQIKEATAKQLAAEATSRADAAASAQQISQLQQTINQNKPVDLTAIISSWRTRVAIVKCEWKFSDGSGAIGTGSGTLFAGGVTGAKLITNGHVVNYKDSLPNQCTIRFPDENTTYTINSANISIVSGVDAAIITIPAPSQYIRSLAGAGRCSQAPATGDSVVILGYPSIGSQTDVTATEGIVSGTDGNYFITSAKVERGNSGGAAILSKKNCYTGIPSFVDLGQIEALARILDQRVVQ